METLAGFFAMGGYGGYVWPAYGLTAVVMLALWLASLWGLRKRQRALARLQAELPEGRRRPTARVAPAP